MFPSPTVDPFTTSESRRRFIKYSISEETWKTKSGASILRSIKAGAGIAIREGDFYRLRTERLEEFARKDQFTALSSDDMVPYSLMNDTHGVKLTNTAQYRLRMTIQNPESGELSYLYRSIGSDDHYTAGEIENFASDLFQMGGEGYSFNIVATELHDVWLQPGGHLS